MATSNPAYHGIYQSDTKTWDYYLFEVALPQSGGVGANPGLSNYKVVFDPFELFVTFVAILAIGVLAGKLMDRLGR